MEKIDGVNCVDNEYCASYYLSCAELAPQLKNLTVVLDTKHYTIPPYGYLLDSRNTAETCIIPVSSVAESSGMVILGDTFIRNFYTVFDFQSNQVKLAPNSANSYGANITPGLSQSVQLTIALCCILAAILIVTSGYFLLRKKHPKGKGKIMKDMTLSDNLVQKVPPYLVHQKH